MAEQSRIEWTDATWNPITGCTLVSEGCRNCYAAELAAGRLRHHPSRQGLARRNAEGVAAFTGEVRLNEDWLDLPLRWRRPRRIFVCAHGDLFHEAVPDEWVDRVFAVMALSPRHTFQVLTKRPERMREYLGTIDDAFHGNPEEMDRRFGEHCVQLTGDPCAAGWFEDEVDWPLPNVWLGVSAEDQFTADARIPPLLATPAAVRFLSAEPLLGPIDLTSIRFRNARGGWEDWNALDEDRHCGTCGARWPDITKPEGGCCAEPTGAESPRLDWVIVGGESGRRARPMHPDWARALRDQCQAAGVPFFFKQWGVFAHELQQDARGHKIHNVWQGGGPDGEWGLHDWPDGTWSVRIGKGHAGRHLDGREWSEMPDIATTIERMRA